LSGSFSNELDNIIENFNRHLAEKSSGIWDKPLKLKKYQVYVAHELLGALKENRFIVVSMPTGSGKTLLEEFTAFYALRGRYERVLVLEPTRFLCDQMYKRQWLIVFNRIVGKEYEGNCQDILDPSKKIVIATPKTVLKCVKYLSEGGLFDFVIIDEVHHTFGNKHYQDLLKFLNPKVIVGFTALLPSDKILSAQELIEIFGTPKLLHYDFKKLKEIDPEFDPPLAIADIYESDFSSDEVKVYNKLLSGSLFEDSWWNKFFERTLVSYGKRALCKSYKSSLENGKINKSNVLEAFCREFKYSHKARTVIEVVNSYEIPQQQKKLTLIYTGRVETANEMREVLGNIIPEQMLKVLTGHVNREERLILLEELKKGKISVLVSTRVGEEGIDIPEAWLLIMLDVVKSPLRFYQRIGRLIRMGSPEKLKHLVLILTPGTFEYDNLEEVLWRLYEEGVDVSYIVANIDLTSKTTIDHIVNTVVKTQEQVLATPSIPFLIYGREFESVNIIKSIEDLVEPKDSESQEILNGVKEWTKMWLDVSLEFTEILKDFVFIILTMSILGSKELKRKILERLGISKIRKNKMYNLINEAIRVGKLHYIYDVEALADIVKYEISRSYNKCAQEYCENVFFRLDSKELLRYFTHIFTPSRLSIVYEEMKKIVETYRIELEKIRNSTGIGEEGISATVFSYPSENQVQKALIYQGIIHLSIGKHVYLLVQVNYYDIDLNMLEEKEKIKELFKLNVEAVLYKALIDFVETLIM